MNDRSCLLLGGLGGWHKLGGSSDECGPSASDWSAQLWCYVCLCPSTQISLWCLHHISYEPEPPLTLHQNSTINTSAECSCQQRCSKSIFIHYLSLWKISHTHTVAKYYWHFKKQLCEHYLQLALLVAFLWSFIVCNSILSDQTSPIKFCGWEIAILCWCHPMHGMQLHVIHTHIWLHGICKHGLSFLMSNTSPPLPSFWECVLP